MNRVDRTKLANVLRLIGACSVIAGCHRPSPNVDDPGGPSSSGAADAASLGGGPGTSEAASGPDASGEKHVVCGSVGSVGWATPETYSFTLMNAKLVKYPKFAHAIGKASVSTCAEARAFMEAYNEYLISNPTFDDELPPKQAHYRQWLAEGTRGSDQKTFDGGE